MFPMLSSLIRRQVFNIKPLNQIKLISEKSQILNQIKESKKLRNLLLNKNILNENIFHIQSL